MAETSPGNGSPVVIRMAREILLPGLMVSEENSRCFDKFLTTVLRATDTLNQGVY